MDEQLNGIVMARALAFAEANRIAQVGDIVETTWGGWKKPRRVRITKIGATLIADWSKDRGFFIDFEMTYVAHRIRKDGSPLEREPTSGICLGNLKTDDGREWVDRCRKVERPNNARWFNHTALSWRLGDTPSPQPNVAGSLKIKELEWMEYEGGLRARQFGLEYFIMPSTMIEKHRVNLANAYTDYAPTIEDAKKIAQDDFDRVVRKVITDEPPAPQPNVAWGDWTVDDTDTAREILNYLGHGSDASREPGADRRRDKIAAMIRARIDAATAPAPKEHESFAILVSRYGENPSQEGFDAIHRKYLADCENARLSAQASPPPPMQHVAAHWLPIEQADKTINHVTEFTQIGLTLKNSDTFWVRDEDGRVYEAAWSEGNNGRDYWWDWEGESPVDPVEFMPHPLDPRFATTEGST